MDIGTLDYYANSGGSFIHRTSAGFKVIFVLCMIVSVVITKSIIILAGIYLAILGFLLLSNIAVIKVLIFASYPGIFALVFAFASWSGNWMFSLLIILKALTAALCMVFLIVTTPYPRVFGSLKPLMPRIIFDAFLLTYRSIFLLFGLMYDLLNALRIRGGFYTSSYIERLKNLSSGLSLLIIRGFDMSHNFYGVLNIRGYEGNIGYSDPDKAENYSDYIFTILGFSVLTLTAYCAEIDRYYLANYMLYVCTLFAVFSLVISQFLKYRENNK